MSFSMNNMAAKIVEEQILPDLDSLQCDAVRLENGATVVDMGIRTKGGWRAAKLFTDTCVGAMGEMTYDAMRIGTVLAPSVAIYVDRPCVAQLGSHDAGLYVPYRGRRQGVSGPLRSLNGADPWARKIDYRDTGAKKAVGHLQTEEFPTAELAGIIADTVGIAPENLYLLAARTGTLVGAVQVCARNIEQTFATIGDRDFNIGAIVHASGYSPVISIVDDENIAYGRVNDCLIYGQESNLYMDCEDVDITRFLEELPFAKNNDVFGTSFEELFAQSEYDWAKVRREWDAPCKVNFINLRTGRFFQTGMIHYGVLERSFWGRID
ncbi:MAG: methenyltetrahydromethanopterin cyclohydrolase [Bacillota bacterium]